MPSGVEEVAEEAGPPTSLRFAYMCNYVCNN